MRHLKGLSFFALPVLLSAQSVLADLSGQLDLVGFVGGSCSISVTPTANASNLNLDNPQPGIAVGTVNKNCTFPHQLAVSTNYADAGITRMMHSNGIDFSDINVSIDGIPINFQASNVPELLPIPPGISSLPVMIDTLSPGSMPGIYENTLTFTLVVD